MNKEELSFLLYLESVAVDHFGKLHDERVNEAEREILKRWTAAGYVESGRIAFEDVTRNQTTWVRLSPKAVADAHAQRTRRIESGWKSKGYKTTAELAVEKARKNRKETGQ